MTHRRNTMLTSACPADQTPRPVPDYLSELVLAVEQANIQALTKPLIIPANEEDAQFDPTEPVLVAAVNGEEQALND
jgi:hypothetical protein